MGERIDLVKRAFADGREIARCALEWLRTGVFGRYAPCCSYRPGATFTKK